MFDLNRRSRWFLGALAVFVLVPLMLVLADQMMSKAYWVGTYQLEVRVQVADVNSLEPIVGAKVTIFDGPITSLEGPLRSPMEKANSQKDVTDKDGFATFTHGFYSYGTDGFLKSTGFVVASRRWVSIEVPGYGTTIVPVSLELRRPIIKHKSPVYVTVLMGKPE